MNSETDTQILIVSRKKDRKKERQKERKKE